MFRAHLTENKSLQGETLHIHHNRIVAVLSTRYRAPCECDRDYETVKGKKFIQ